MYNICYILNEKEVNMKRTVLDNNYIEHKDVCATGIVNNNNDPVIVGVYEGGHEGKSLMYTLLAGRTKCRA